MFLVFLDYLAFASSFPLVKMALQYSGPFFLTGLRMVTAGIILLCFQRGNFKISKKEWGYILLLSFFNIYLANSMQTWGQQQLTSAKTSFLLNISPFASAILSYFLLDERLNLKKILGLIIGFLGFLPILLSSNSGVSAISFISWSELAVIVGAVSAAYGWIVMKKTVGLGTNIIFVNGISMLIGGLFCFINSAFTETSVTITPWFLFLVLVSTLLSNVIGYSLYSFLLRRYSVTFMTFAGFSSPFFAAILGWLMMGETITWHLPVSAVIVIIGFYIYLLK